jgi:hypothetical protein
MKDGDRLVSLCQADRRRLATLVLLDLICAPCDVSVWLECLFYAGHSDGRDVSRR